MQGLGQPIPVEIEEDISTYIPYVVAAGALIATLLIWRK